LDTRNIKKVCNYEEIEEEAKKNTQEVILINPAIEGV
jgi:hypothetical protein